MATRLRAAVSHAINIFSLLHLNCCIWITVALLSIQLFSRHTCTFFNSYCEKLGLFCHFTIPQPLGEKWATLITLCLLTPIHRRPLRSKPPCTTHNPSTINAHFRSFGGSFVNYFFFAVRFLFNYLYKLQTDKNNMASKKKKRASNRLRYIRYQVCG